MALTFALPPESKMLTACRTCNALNKTTLYTLNLIKEKDLKKILEDRKPPISAQDVKDFFNTPAPSVKTESAKSAAEEPVTGSAGVKKP
jgi:hypothetical protein